MISERILQLLSRQMGCAATDEELKELQDLLRQHPEHNFLLEILQSVKGERLHKEPALEEDQLVQESWLMLKKEMDDIKTIPKPSEMEDNVEIPKGNKFFGIKMGWAAIWGGIILLAGSSFFMLKYLEKTAPQPIATKIKQVELPYGAPVKKLLPDSSVVWLNAGSHIWYADNFVQKNRDVYLDGEAFFSVKHDAKHPFIVHAGNITVRALGTKFNVLAYKNENKIEATLISGKIMVKIDGKPDQSIILIPNEKLTVTNQNLDLTNKNTEVGKGVSFEVKEVSPIVSSATLPEVAWLQDKLAFQNEAFDELAKRMERRYNIRIIFKDTSLGEERLSGVFENENIKKAMDLLQMTTSFRYRIQGDSAVYLNR
ncbi:MAG: FecR domain-containing protein [Ginsengibacter sp.]